MVDFAKAPRLAVLGSPIAHSLSPALHLAAYRALGLDWRYEAVEVGAGALQGFLAGLGTEWRGLSLTMPLKQEVLALLTNLDHVASRTEAANTVLFCEANGQRTLSGFNTDVAGLVRALAEADVTAATHVTVLGAGATATSALMAAAELGAEDVSVLVRTPAKAAPLVHLGRSLGLVVSVTALPGASEPAVLNHDTHLVISTLPGGATPGIEFPAELAQDDLLLDVSYSPWPSALALSWQAAGGTAVSGLTMLLHQALIQVRIFVGGDPFAPLPDEPAVLAAMRRALPAPAVKG